MRLTKKLSKLVTPRALKIGGVVFGVFVLLNVGAFAYYRGRTFSNTTVAGHRLGSITFDAAETRLKDISLLPEDVELSYQETKNQTNLSELGISIDYDKTAAELRRQRSWLPLANFFTSHNVPVRLNVDHTRLQDYLTSLADRSKQHPVDAHIIQQNGTFSIKNEVSGHQLNSTAAQEVIIAQLGQGNVDIALPVAIAEPAVKSTDLAQPLQALQAQQNTQLTLKYQDKSKRFSPAEVAAWYVPAGTSMAPDDAKIKDSVSKVGGAYGIGVQNLDQAVAAIKQALQKAQPLDFALVPAPRITYAYCVGGRGVDASHLSGLEQKLASVLGDKRGWNLNGRIGFAKVSSGCGFTVWLSAAHLLPTFGAICTPDWSCRVGTSVVINFDRWQNASAAWNASGGSLEDYRVMVINHEVGHWLGFDHKNCGGPGQPAPVMQQQSIDLQGCKFNPWPLPSELQALQTSLKL